MKYVIIGASAAGINGAENLRALDKDGEIILISKDTHVYSRCILHHYIGEMRDVDGINFVDKDFFEKNNINWIKGREVISLDENKKIITLDDGEVISYDKVLIASGSRPFFPPIENINDKENVVGLKSLDDCNKIIEISKKAKNIVVIGAGLIGMDAITGLLHNPNVHANLSLIEMSDRLLPLQLDKEASITYEKKLLEKGVKLFFNSKVTKLNVNPKNSNLINCLSLVDDGCDIELLADLVIVCAGVKSNTEFLQNTSVEFDKIGLLFNEKGETNVKDIYGAGDVSGRGTIWSVAVKDGIVATSNMAGVERIMDDFFFAKSTMNFFDIPTLSLGCQSIYEKNPSIIVESIRERNGVYKKIAHRDGKIYGAIIQGDLSYTGVLTQLIRLGIDFSKIKKSIFNIDYSDFFNINSELEFEYKN
ncbi:MULTISPECIES: NAD(P)/FAD-dependent oxidoreductase [Cetobacterium]|jgi:NAD(P)H-nitrite reductase large subunit|uniref:FAD-dependent oxidoreductase n=1 Tax=Candidatus Cetobacterium colombiensis TaxID=3073100 RepID=A0ABU4W924_9FUSO|nr:FAD-dependent oxidoreductase [Candidatus Cetobacterium colombiensis]MDX8336018.1 FAD-dependent oxidoreductase [Candidatus Cetobacterium colombiensis]